MTIKAVIKLCKKLLKGNKASNNAKSAGPQVITRDAHNISRAQISPNALKVLYRLNKGGYDAYLVGGAVRDLLLGHEPKDFDIATNATPEQIKALFRNCRLIGRRFRLAHIMFGREIIEVATFRGHHDSAPESQKACKKTSKQSDDGMLLRDNIYGTIDEDAERRDFTVNAMYYSVADFNVYDFANGVEDLNNGIIRLIGDPETRYREDPVRMLRAVRFATKLDMTISDDTAAPIHELAPLMNNIPAARMFEEYLKLFMGGKALDNFKMLSDFHLLEYIFPHTRDLDKTDLDCHIQAFIDKVLMNTDARINDGKRVTPAFLLAAIMWYPLQEKITRLKAQGELTPQDAFFEALHEVMREQQERIAIPKRFQAPIKDIWFLQHRLIKREGKNAFKQLGHPKFRAAYDFLWLRGQIEGGEALELATWWTNFQEATPEKQNIMVKSIRGGRTGARKKTLRRKRKPSSGASTKPHANNSQGSGKDS